MVEGKNGRERQTTTVLYRARRTRPTLDAAFNASQPGRAFSLSSSFSFPTRVPDALPNPDSGRRVSRLGRWRTLLGRVLFIDAFPKPGRVSRLGAAIPSSTGLDSLGRTAPTHNQLITPTHNHPRATFDAASTRCVRVRLRRVTAGTGFLNPAPGRVSRLGHLD